MAGLRAADLRPLDAGRRAGNTAAAGDENGAIAIQHFDAFGVALDAVAVSGCRAAPLPDLAAAGDAGYRGQEGYRTHLTDPDAAPNQGPPHRSTGLMLLGARDYDPVLGRFMEPDPLSYDPGAAMQGIANRWAYCGNDPVNASDPSGRSGFALSGYDYFLISIAVAMVGVGVALAYYGMPVAGIAMALGAIALILDILGDKAVDPCTALKLHALSALFSGLAIGVLLLGALMAAAPGAALAAIGGMLPLIAKFSHTTAYDLMNDIQGLGGNLWP